MNTPIQLTGREILYAASKIGADQFIGIEDEFLFMPEEELRKEIPLIQNSLIKKGCATLDFDGNFFISDPIKEELECCAFCEQYLSAERKMPLNIVSYKSYYVGKKEIVRIGKNGKSYEITEITKARMSQEISGDFNWNDSSEPRRGEACLDQLLLEALKEEDFSPGLRERLKQEGCGNEMIKILLDGIKGSAEVFRFVAIDLKREKNVSVSGIYGQAGILELSGTEVDFEEKVKVSFQAQNDLQNKIKRILVDFGLWEEEQFV